MSTKTISLKREAYDRLRAARRYPEESFSEVVLRATWPEDTVTASNLLRLYRGRRPRLPERLLDRVEARPALMFQWRNTSSSGASRLFSLRPLCNRHDSWRLR
jgi:hypothetical protein